MKINKLKLRGAIGIWKGLGKEEIEIDFTQFGPGLIALTGKNGSGKTTIMENLHPYRCMVSRTGSLQSHFFLKDSYRILEFEHNGNRYESKILIDALTGGSEAYIIENGKPLNDGKLTTYDEVIESVLGSQELFFNSVFSGQKSRGIAELKPSERRKLFYELLNLNIYEKYLEQTKEKLKANELKLSEINGKIQAFQTDDEQKIKLETDRIEKLENQVIVSQNITEIKNKIESHKKQLNEIEKDKIRSEQQLKKREELLNKKEQIDAEIKKLIMMKKEKDAQLNSAISEQEQLIQRYEKIIENKNDIDKALTELKQLNDEITHLSNDKIKLREEEARFLQEVNSKQTKLNEEKEHLNALQSKISAADAEHKTIKKELANAKAEIQLINKVPCNVETGANCRFLHNAFVKKDMIPELTKKFEEQLKMLQNLERQYDEGIIVFNKNYNDFIQEKEEKKANFKRFFEKTDQKLKELHAKKNTLEKQNWTKLKDEALNAETEVRIAQEKIANLKSQILENETNFKTRHETLQKDAKEIDAKLIELKAVDEHLAFITGKVNTIKKEIENLENEHLMKITDLDEIKRIISSIEAQQKTIAENEKKIKELESEKGKTQSEIKDWTFLVKAFDKTGIPVLKLENSGIEITTIANELLALFENQFRIVFETTQLTKDKKKMKETFNINVLSGDDVIEISNLSGGQQVWVETAIQLAISLLVRQQGNNIETSFLDEKDGALDIENAHLYLNMLKLAHQKSGVHNTFVITHRPELIDLIPQKITLGDGLLLSEVA